MKIKTSELEGAALDWAVAVAIGWKEPIFGVGLIRYFEEDRYLMMETPDPNEPDDVTKPHHFNHYEQWSPRRIWSQGGLLIEKYIHLISQDGKGGMYAQCVSAPTYEFGEGPTILIASCRAIVASVLGDEVDVQGALSKTGHSLRDYFAQGPKQEGTKK